MDSPRSRLPVAFPALLVGLLSVIALAVPFPYGPTWEGGLPFGDGLAMCLRLNDGQSARETLAPPTVILLQQPAPGLKAFYVARFSRMHQIPGEGLWRLLNSDTLEIRWYHSPSIRLALHGRTLSGPRGTGRCFAAVPRPVPARPPCHRRSNSMLRHRGLAGLRTLKPTKRKLRAIAAEFLSVLI